MIDPKQAKWRLNERRSMTENRFYIDFVSDPTKGVLGLVAENLTYAKASEMVKIHNQNLEH